MIVNDMNVAPIALKTYDTPTLLLVETDHLDCITVSDGDTPRVFWDW